MAKNEFQPTGFIDDSGIRIAKDALRTSYEDGVEYNDSWTQRSAELGGEEDINQPIFHGSMDLLGLYGTEKGGSRTVSSKDHEELWGSFGVVLCETREGDDGKPLQTVGTLSPVSLQISDTYRWAHEGPQTPTDRRTRETTIDIQPETGYEAVTYDAERTKQVPFIPAYGKQREGYYPTDMQVTHIRLVLLDGKVSELRVDTRGHWDEGNGLGKVVIDMTAQRQARREANDRVRKMNLYEERNERLLASLMPRIEGCFAIAHAPQQKEKTRRINNAELMRRGKVAANSMLDLGDGDDLAA